MSEMSWSSFYFLTRLKLIIFALFLAVKLSPLMLFLESVKVWIILTGGCECHCVCRPSFVSTRWGARCVNSNLFGNGNETLTSKLSCFVVFIKMNSQVFALLLQKCLLCYINSPLNNIHIMFWSILLWSVARQRHELNKIKVLDLSRPSG